MSRITTVLFDIDDTLFDHRYSARAALTFLRNEYLASLGSVPLDELERANLEILEEVHADVLSGALSVDEAREKRCSLLFRRYDVELSLDECHRLAGHYRMEYQRSRRPTIGAMQVLEELRLRGITIGVISNNLVAEQLDKLEQCGLIHLIDSLTISEEAGYSKPHPRIFQIALERLHATAEETVLVGDAWVNDIEGAQRVGIRPIWYNCYQKPIPDESVEQLFSFENVFNVVEMILKPHS